MSSMSFDDFQAAFKQAKDKDFKFDEIEVRSIFKYITKSKGTAGVQIDIQQLTNAVYESVKGSLIE